MSGQPWHASRTGGGGRTQRHRDGRVGPSTYDARAPANYVPGRGRGAAGFSTQMDLGPAGPTDIAGLRMSAAAQATGAASAAGAAGGRGLQRGSSGPPRGYRAGVGRGAVPLSKDAQADGDSRDYTQFDPQTGYSGHNLFNVEGDEEDDEADRLYAEVEAKMAKRRKRQREEGEARRAEAARAGARPKISEILAPYKAELATVTEDEWASIPDVGDHSLKYKAPEENFTPMPASFIEAQRRKASSSAGGNQSNFVASVHGMESSVATPLPGARGAAHRSIDGLASMARSSGTSTVIGGHKSVDPQGYLTSLASMDAQQPDLGNVGDIAKNRKLFRSLRESNPEHGMSWISGAKLEESCGKMSEARRIIRGACAACGGCAGRTCSR